MQDMQAYLEKLYRDAVDCALISKRATDAQKKELFDRLDALQLPPMRALQSSSTTQPISKLSYAN
jgi:hypothetical protein